MITYNEVDHIDGVLECLNFADEIIVIDSFSTDGTFEKLDTNKGVKVIQRAFNNFADQRNFAIAQATNKWLFFIDADERLTEASQEEIKEIATNNTAHDAYKIPRTFLYQDKVIRFSGLQTDQVFRLFKNGTATYIEDRLVHEILDVKGSYGVLKHKMLHYSFANRESYKQKAEHYGKLKAEELFKKGKRPNAFHFYVKPTYKFLSNYIFRLGFLDGKAGYIICYLNAYGVWYRYKTLERLRLATPK